MLVLSGLHARMKVEHEGIFKSTRAKTHTHTHTHINTHSLSLSGLESCNVAERFRPKDFLAAF